MASLDFLPPGWLRVCPFAACLASWTYFSSSFLATKSSLALSNFLSAYTMVLLAWAALLSYLLTFFSTSANLSFAFWVIFFIFSSLTDPVLVWPVKASSFWTYSLAFSTSGLSFEASLYALRAFISFLPIAFWALFAFFCIDSTFTSEIGVFFYFTPPIYSINSFSFFSSFLVFLSNLIILAWATST